MAPACGYEGAAAPFWSPDSQSVAFFSLGKLKRIPVAGGPARILAEETGSGPGHAGGGTWTTGTILFARTDGSVARIPDTGGSVTPVETLPWKAGEIWFVGPRFLYDEGSAHRGGGPGSCRTGGDS